LKSPSIDEATCCAAPSASTILRFIAPAIFGPAKTVTAVAKARVAMVAPRLIPRSEPHCGVNGRMTDISNFGGAARGVAIIQATPTPAISHHEPHSKDRFPFAGRRIHPGFRAGDPG
jgi:hypothetical protein